MVRFALAVTVAALSSAVPLAAQNTAQSEVQPGETLLSVQAQGRARYVPDMATLNVGVVSTGTTAREATDANARNLAAVITALRNAGVEGRYIRTQQISVQPRFARSSPADYQGQAEITGYVVNNSVAVTITKLDTAPEVITAAFGAGANSVNGPTLASRDPQVGASAARAEAVANAQKEAEEYAAALGLRIVRVLRVVDSPDQSGGSNEVFVSAHRIVAAAPTPVSAGEMTRTVTIWADFALAPK